MNRNKENIAYEEQVKYEAWTYIEYRNGSKKSKRFILLR